MPSSFARLAVFVLATLLAFPSARVERELVGCGGGCEADCRCASCVLGERAARTDAPPPSCCAARSAAHLPVAVSVCTCGHDEPGSAQLGGARIAPRPVAAPRFDVRRGEPAREMTSLVPPTRHPDPEVPPPRVRAV